MKLRAALVVLFALLAGVTFGIESGYADDEPVVDKDGDGKPDEPAKPVDKDGDGKPDPVPGDKDGDGKPDIDHKAGAPDDKVDAQGHDAVDNKDSDGDGIPDWKEDNDGDGISDADEKRDSDGDGIPDIEEVSPDEDADEDDPAIKVMDADGDGVVEANEVADNKEFDKDLKEMGIPKEVDEAALDKRKAGGAAKALVASMTVEKFQELVKHARKVVLGKMEVKAGRKAAKKMKIFSFIVFGVSGLGIFLLLAPLFLNKKYPGQGKTLFKYSALAALTFIVTVNLFGGVLYGLRSIQTLTSKRTNPSVAIAGGTFDTLHEDAHEYAVMGKELFGPSLRQMREHPEEQPATLLLENSMKIVQDAKVFLSIKNMFKKVDWLFGIIPIILTLVTLILFVLAIKPTLVEIVRMPAQIASGQASGGQDIVKKSMARVIGEVKATICTIGVLVAVTMLSGFVLGLIVKPAMRAFVEYFSKSVNYLQFAEEASSGLVFVALFGVILFLVFNLAVLILSMAFFLGKAQKIFQAKFNDDVPISTHFRFFKWGVPSVVLVQIFPLVFAFAIAMILNAINDTHEITDANAVPWTKIMLLGPVFLVGLFVLAFWAVRGVKAIKYLATYKVKVTEPPGVQLQSPAPAGKTSA